MDRNQPRGDGSRSRFGDLGIWIRSRDLTAADGRAVEEFGFSTLWVGGSPAGDLAAVERVLENTLSLVVATGVCNMWKTSPTELSRSYHRLADRFPGRFVLGVGVGHAEQVGEMYERPYESLMRYLDVLDGCGVPASDRVIAALGDRMLRVSAERSLGAHTYLVPSKHTLHARHLVGIDAEIAPCTKVVFGDSIEVATEEAAKAIADPYLGLVNYRNSLLRLGYSGEEIQHPRSIVADLVAMPTPGAVVARANEHGAAGASHVSLQLVGSAARHLTESLGLLADAFVTRRLFREP